MVPRAACLDLKASQMHPVRLLSPFTLTYTTQISLGIDGRPTSPLFLLSRRRVWFASTPDLEAAPPGTFAIRSSPSPHPRSSTPTQLQQGERLHGPTAW